MFGLFGKKKVEPENALEAFIHAVYGNPPPSKTAVLQDAINLAHVELLMGQVSKDEISKVAQGLYNGPIPYSTHDLAVSVALNFYRQEEKQSTLSQAQLLARMHIMGWISEGKLNPNIAETFENSLYKLYKP